MINVVGDSEMKLLTNIRAWKNKHFQDWLLDLLVGACCGVIGLLGLFFNANWLVLVVPFLFTVWNQLVINRLFEPKDFALRMAIPIIIFVIQLFI